MDSIKNGYLTRYLEQNMVFAKTVVVKLAEAAELINESLVATYGKDCVNSYAPETWKYYLNLAGQYHPTDTMMSVVSIDTLEPIDFTLKNLAVHTATAKAHAYGTRHYNSLVAQYPRQESLINGLLNPADIAHAVAAENGTILAYPAGLIEANEVSLVEDLEKYLKRQFMRWYNVQFAMSDNLFVAVFFTILSLFLLPKLMNLRLARCKTHEAHSFHVRMYLASHGELDRYLPYLTLKQSLWLYRNITQLERNPGKASQFAVLVEKLLTERGIPLGEYSIRHLDQFTEDYLPVQIARIKLLNADANALKKDYHSVEALFVKEEQSAEDNVQNLAAMEDTYLMRLKTANSAVTQTKVLNSSMVDYSGAVPEPFELVALRQWCYLANQEMYPVSISFKDPSSSITRTLFAKDAFFYLQYILMSAEGLTFETVPQFLNMQQRIHPRPTVAELLSVAETKPFNLRELAELIVTRQPVIEPCYSVSAFYEHAQLLTDEAYWHWHLISSIEDCYERALVENMIKRLYEDVRMDYTLSTTNVADWLSKNNLPPYALSYSEAQALAQSIFEAATGITIDNTRMLRNIQKAMLDLMKELSSYSVQFTREINADDVIPINWPAIRLGNLKYTQKDSRFVDNGTEINRADGHLTSVLPVNGTVTSDARCRGNALTGRVPIQVDSTIDGIVKTISRSSANDYGPALVTFITYPGQNVALEESLLLPGYTSFEKLPESFRQNLKSIYTH